MLNAPRLPVCRSIRRSGEWSKANGSVSLSYEDRFLRRKRLLCIDGTAFHLDLPEAVGLNQGDALELDDGRLIAVDAAEEVLLVVTGDLPRLAWHIGNRHTPCQIEPDCLLIRRDHVLHDMLVRLGATVREVFRPFAPEGGAYGLGRTLGHSHGGDHRHHGPHA